MKKLGIINLFGILFGLGGIVCYAIGDIITGTLSDKILSISQVCIVIFAVWFTSKLWVLTQKIEE